mgnify:FL=1
MMADDLKIPYSYQGEPPAQQGSGDDTNKDAGPEDRLAPTRVCIVTCDRPEAVGRLPDSMLMSGELSQHDGFFMVGDSHEAAARNAADMLEDGTFSTPSSPGRQCRLACALEMHACRNE